MGVEGKKKYAPPLPAPTETESTFTAPLSDLGTDLGTDVSRPGDDKSSYSIPEDGTPVTIRPGHRASKSQTSLLIEYFEGGKGSSAGSGEQRKPSVRVRLTPSSKHKSRSGSDRDRIEITQTKSRKASLSRRSAPNSAVSGRSEGEMLSALGGDHEDASSYASATEESNVSRNPIDIEIDRSGNVRRRRPASPLIPAADMSKNSYVLPTGSEISAIPTDSFLDGSGPTTSFGMSETKSGRSRSPSRGGDYLAGAATGLAAAAAADKLRNKSRGEIRDKERVVVSKTREREREKEKDRKHKSSSKTRASSLSKEDKYAERAKSPRRKSSRGHSESLVSAADSSVVSSAVTPSHRSMDQHSIRSTTSKASSINNPKLLETVEDAIRRLILPELNALKREQSRGHKDRRGSTSSATTVSRDDYASDRRRSSGTDKNTVTPRDSLKARERRDREARNDFDDSPAQSAISHDSIDDSHHIDDTPMRSTDRLKAAAVGAGLGAAAIAAHEALKSPSDDKRSRRRRRAEMRRGTSEQTPEPEDADSEYLAPAPPISLPLMSDINPSELTRTSILSADSDRPHSASEELTPGRELDRSQLSPESSPTPTRAGPTLQALGAQHANISHGDLKALPRQRTGEYEPDEYGKKVPGDNREYDDDEYDEPEVEYSQSGAYDYYSTQDVPPPLKYVPYQPERRGLSPIPSVSGYTEGGSEAPNRDSRLTQHTSDSVSTAEKSPRAERSLRSPSSIPSNIMSRDFVDDDRSLRSSGIDQGVTMSAADSELDRVTSGQAVRAVAMNPDFVHPVGIESNVASLVDGSMLDGSVLTAESSAVGNQHYNGGRESMATLEEERSRAHDTPTKRSVGSHHEYVNERGATPSSASYQSREYEEYDVDEYGRKFPQSSYRQSPTASEEAITSAAVRSAAAVLRAQNGNQQPAKDDGATFVPAGVQRNLSFKERTRNAPVVAMETDHHEKPKLGFNSLPDPNDPLPNLDHWQEDDMVTNPSLLDGNTGEKNEQGQWPGDTTPRQAAQQQLDDDIHYEQLDNGHETPDNRQKSDGHGLGIAGGAAAAALGAAAIMASTHQHSRQPSQEQDEEWYRTSDDRKRDTLVTNPYEGTSPIANLPGINDNLLPPRGFENADYGALYPSHSPLGHKDEGYASQGPNKSPDMQNKGKGVDFDLQPRVGGNGTVDDPFYTPKHTRHLSGMSHGLDSPLYDAATGAGIDQIESKDIIALMQHLMVRDAQRSARDTEILVTLVRSATEMRNNFEDIKRMLADTEDVIITEVKENTEKTVQRAINGPRPYPGSGARSLQAPSQAGTDDVNAKKRSIFRRALKGLSAKGANDLGRIEDMLMQLLTEVDVLKAQTAPDNLHGNHQDEQLYSHIQPEIQYEQDRGYEPEGNAGTSTASHASQSGHLSVQSRGASTKPGYDRRTSANRISTVPEDNEDEYDHDNLDESVHYSKPDMLMTPAQEQRGSSVPLATPPDALAQTQTHTSASNDNTPRTADGKKKSGTRSSWFPKISRWSETTTSSVAQVFRRSGQSHKNDEDGEPQYPQPDDRKFHSAPSRSRTGSLASYSDNFQFSDPHQIQSDKLHTGFSDQNLGYAPQDNDSEPLSREDLYPPPPITGPGYVSMTPEDPKYKAHRNSLNLQHPQPRQGQTERFKVALESQAMGFDSPTSPRSADWAGSSTSLNRFPRQAHRDSYGSAGDHSQQHWTSSPGAANLTATSGPPRPPKEPMDHASSPGRGTPPQNKRLSKLQKHSPLPHHSVESGYGTMTHGVPTASYISHSRDGGSPRLENRNLSGALGVSRRPSGPRPMTPKSVGSAASDDGRDLSDSKRKRDTFGTVTSQDTDTF